MVGQRQVVARNAASVRWPIRDIAFGAIKYTVSLARPRSFMTHFRKRQSQLDILLCGA